MLFKVPFSLPFEIQWIRRRPSLAAPTDGPNPKEAVSRPLFIAICSVFGRKCLVKKMVQNEQNLHRPLLHKMQYVSIEIAVLGYFFESGRLWGHRPLPPTVLATRSLELGTWSLELAAWNLELGTWSLELGTWSLELGTWSLELGICSPARGLQGYAMPCYAALCYAML